MSIDHITLHACGLVDTGGCDQTQGIFVESSRACLGQPETNCLLIPKLEIAVDDSQVYASCASNWVLANDMVRLRICWVAVVQPGDVPHTAVKRLKSGSH